MTTERGVSSSCSPSTERLERVFRYCDKNGDGKVSPLELCSRMNHIGLNLSIEEAIEAVRASGVDGDGLLGLDEFSDLIPEEEQDAEARDREMREAFVVYEMESSGFITDSSLRAALNRMGNDSEIDDCKAMIRRYDLDGDGAINFAEFKAMLIL